MSLRLLQSPDLVFVIVKYVTEANWNNGLFITLISGLSSSVVLLCSTSYSCSARSEVEAFGLLEFCWSSSLQNALAELLGAASAVRVSVLWLHCCLAVRKTLKSSRVSHSQGVKVIRMFHWCWAFAIICEYIKALFFSTNRRHCYNYLKWKRKSVTQTWRDWVDNFISSQSKVCSADANLISRLH